MRSALAAMLRSIADPGLLRLRAAAVTYVTALISAVIAGFLSAWLGLGVSLVVLAVMLSLSLTADRTGSGTAQRWLSIAVMPVIGVAAGGVALLMAGLPVVGDTLFVVVLSGAIWVRRFGPTAARLGTLVSLPFITVLVVPVPVPPGGSHPPGWFAAWAALIAVVVSLVALTVQWCARATGWTARPAPRTEPVAPAPPRRRASGMRPMASTRMAIQLAITLSGAFLIGHLVFGEHWFWTVLTAYVVSAGNRGRGDVLFKGIHRTVGAIGGTLVAALLSLLAARHGELGSTEGVLIIVAIAVILALGLWLRPAGYGWWAAAMTAMLSLLSELEGVAPGPALLLRLAAIVVAGALATAVAWWVLPVRTGDALRRRTADALAALTELLVACIREPEAIAGHRASAEDALGRLAQLGPTLRLERAARLRGRSDMHGVDIHRADVIPAMQACWVPADGVAVGAEHGHPVQGAAARELGGIARRLVAYRRMLAGAEPPPPAEPAPDFPELGEAVAALEAPLRTVARRAP